MNTSMANDLLRRLLSEPHGVAGTVIEQYYPRALLKEAHDEIERLTRELGTERSGHLLTIGEKQWLSADRDRLRASLDRIADIAAEDCAGCPRCAQVAGLADTALHAAPPAQSLQSETGASPCSCFVAVDRCRECGHTYTEHETKANSVNIGE